MKKISIIFILVCASLISDAQTSNYVKNPSFEDTLQCPYEINQISFAKYWSCAIDTVGEPYYAPEYYNSCAGTTWPIRCGVPENGGGYQYPRTGNTYIGAHLYYDKTPPSPSGLSSSWRDYAQGRLHKPLIAGQAYCVSYWVVLTERSGYAHDNIGAYIDDGSINKMGTVPGEEITWVTPQVYSTSKIKDTGNWTKIEGSFVATGNETHITLGNFAKQIDVDTDIVPYFALSKQYSYYLFDDISVIPIDLAAEAGKDAWVPMGSTVKIGRVSDTTALGLDCKWYKKGVLIDSGAIISVNASSVINSIDTYVVVQTVCGLVKSDTVTVKTTALGIPLLGGVRGGFTIYPNPSNGTFTLTSLRDEHSSRPQVKQSVHAKVYDLLGRVVHQQELSFTNNETSIKLNTTNGIYILELKDNEGNVWRERVVVE